MLKHDLTVDPSFLFTELPEEKQQLYQQFCQHYNFPLDPFQVYSIYGLLCGDNVLVTVPTSCGKTIIAEFAIFEQQYIKATSALHDMTDCVATTPPLDYVYRDSTLKTRVIYTSPIKTLSNQKYSEFSEKFGRDRVGIITGDIKFNPEASLLIMTTEILRDLVLKNNELLQTVATVIFDEVHYINNEERGYVWEESLMLLPESVKLVMLSATMGNPEEFAKWISNIKGRSCHLTVHNVRPVRLNHQLYMVHNTGEDPEFKSYFVDHKLDADLYRTFIKEWENPGSRIIVAAKKNGILPPKVGWKVGEKQALNQLVKQLEQEDKCPALFFVFSRRKCEMYAKMLEMSFHDPVKQGEVEKIVNHYLAKYQYKFETLKLSVQMAELTRLAKLGISYHHASLLPFAKEIVEQLFQRGLIKVMFVTETFSVGINMPTRTVVFSELSKNVNGTWRPLWTDEFYQMAGRAGRRGLDTEGHVIYAPINRILSVDCLEKMITGTPFAFKGKFSFDYVNLLQHLACHQDFRIVEKAFLYQGLNDRIDKTKERQTYLEQRLSLEQRANDGLGGSSVRPESQIPETHGKEESMIYELLIEYQQLQQEQQSLTSSQMIGRMKVIIDPKEKKKLTKQIEGVQNKMKSVGMYDKKGLKKEYSDWLNSRQEHENLVVELEKCREFLSVPESVLKSEYLSKLNDLQKMGYLERNSGTTGDIIYQLTLKGTLAARIQTADGLLVSQLLMEGAFQQFDAETLALALVSLASDLPEDDQVNENRELRYFWDRCRKLSNELTENFMGYEPPKICSVFILPTLLWYRGSGFHETVASISELQGNFVRVMLRLIHLCEEIVKCFIDTSLVMPSFMLDLEVMFREIVEKVNRDVIIFDSIYIKSKS